MPLTDITVKNAKPRAKKYKVFDGEGLYLEVLPTGGKYWRMKYFFAGKERLLALGVYPHISLADARSAVPKRERCWRLAPTLVKPKRKPNAFLLINTPRRSKLLRENGTRTAWPNGLLCMQRKP